MITDFWYSCKLKGLNQVIPITSFDYHMEYFRSVINYGLMNYLVCISHLKQQQLEVDRKFCFKGNEDVIFFQPSPIFLL